MSRDHTAAQRLSLSCYFCESCQHRDIKLENLLFDSEGPEAILKICDFGFSAKFKKGQKFKKTLGTVDYLAPEVLEGNYTEVGELWG